MLAITPVQLVDPDHAMPEAASYREPSGRRVWLGGRRQRHALTNVDKLASIHQLAPEQPLRRAATVAAPLTRVLSPCLARPVR